MMKETGSFKKLCAAVLSLAMILTILPVNMVKGATLRPGMTDEKTAYVPAGCELYLEMTGDGWDEFNSGVGASFESTNQSVAKVVKTADQGYVLKGIKKGKATITAKSKLGKIELDVVVLPKYDVRVKNFKDVKKNGKTVGYRFDVVNKSKKAVTILEGLYGRDVDIAYSKVKGKKVTVKPGETKTVTVLFGWSSATGVTKNGKMADGWSMGLGVKYEGHPYTMWYDRDGKKPGVLIMKLMKDIYA